MEDDVFCKIINGQIPCYKIYEDENVLAFLDSSQVTPGHTLVVSKKHYDNFLSVPQKEMHDVMDVAQKIGQIQIEILHAEGVNILTNCYEAAGQSVMHFHVHVIPRYSDNRDRLVIEMKPADEKDLNLPTLQQKLQFKK
ncbi:MAG: HIT family protein [Coprobacillus sp.]|nr:HIT family protein [Coprobacillus sp.]